MKVCGNCIYWTLDNTGECKRGIETGSENFPACGQYEEEEL